MRRFESLVLCTAKNRRVTLQLALCTGGSSPQVNQLQIMWYYSTNLLKKSACKWTCAVQNHVVQRSSVTYHMKKSDCHFTKCLLTRIREYRPLGAAPFHVHFVALKQRFPKGEVPTPLGGIWKQRDVFRAVAWLGSGAVVFSGLWTKDPGHSVVLGPAP